MKLNSAGTLDEEHAQIAIAALGDVAKYHAVTGRHLSRYQTQLSHRDLTSAFDAVDGSSTRHVSAMDVGAV
jgi:hypothetical protein